MSIDTHTALKVARLARLSLPADRIGETVDGLNRILDWVEALQKVPTDAVEPMLSVHLTAMPERDDGVTDGGYADLITGAAPDQAYGFFAIRKFVE